MNRLRPGHMIEPKPYFSLHTKYTRKILLFALLFRDICILCISDREDFSHSNSVFSVLLCCKGFMRFCHDIAERSF